MVRLIAAVVVLAVTVAGGGAQTPQLRVLFVGNSYTSSNDLPEVVARMAASIDRNVEVGISAPGGWWLRDHAASAETLDLIAEGNWDIVILQEQSMAPAVPSIAETVSYPAVLQLWTVATQQEAELMLSMTWAHRDGRGRRQPPHPGRNLPGGRCNHRQSARGCARRIRRTGGTGRRGRRSPTRLG